MRCWSRVRIALAFGLVVVGSVTWPEGARGDGGTLRAWQRQGPFEIAVFSDPTPFVVGEVDISVLVLDVATGDPVPAASVTVEIAPSGRPGAGARYVAMTQAATNKLLRAAVFEMPAPGPYEIKIAVEREADRAELQFHIDVARPWTPRTGIWAWILGPFPLIGVYGVHRALVARRVRVTC